MTDEPGLLTVLRDWGWIGCTGFGGPPAHIRLLRRLCVERRGWLEAAEFEDALAACNLLPGPASTQLAIFCAWRVRGRAGALAGGIAFILPGLVMILLLSWLFLAGSPPLWVRGAGAGAGAAVAAVALQAGGSLVPASWRRAAAASRVRWLVYLAAGATAAASIGPWLVLVLLGCGICEAGLQYARRGADRDGDQLSGRRDGVVRPGSRAESSGGRRARRPDGQGDDESPDNRGGVGRPGSRADGEQSADPKGAGRPGGESSGGLGRWLAVPPLPLLAVGAISGGIALSVAWVAIKVGALSFGGGFVIVPLMHADAVGRYHWMTGGQFLNAVALGQITPGPVVQTVSTVGYAAAGLAGGLLAAVVAFTPSFAFILLGARHFDRLRGNQRAGAFLGGAGPAAIGAILGSAIPLARALSEPWQFGLLGAATVILLPQRRGVVLTLLASAAVGVIVALASGPLPG